MKSIKICPQCRTEFEGRSNKIYCSPSCKMEAFQNKQLTDTAEELPNQAKEKKSKSTKENDAIARHLTPDAIALEKYRLELKHQRDLAKAEYERRQQAIKEQELALAREKKEQELQQRQIAQALEKEFEPIKTEACDIIDEIIENGRDAVWEVDELEELLDDIDDIKDKIKKFYRHKFMSFHDTLIYQTMDELEQELESILDEMDTNENEDEVIVNFKKSYINQLVRAKQQF